MIRILAVAGGLMTGAVTAQFPEFSQQYTQRLGGAVDELRVVVDDFDRSAASAGLDRDQALSQLTGTTFLDNRRADMTRTFTRFDRLQSDLDALQGGTAFTHLGHFTRFRDREIADRVFETFQPAIPISTAGLAFAGGGYLVGWGFLTGLFGLFGLRRRMA